MHEHTTVRWKHMIIVQIVNGIYIYIYIDDEAHKAETVPSVVRYRSMHL
jgi:hypothetical protein